MSFSEILVILIVVAFATKAAAYFAANAGSLTLAARRAVAVKAVIIQAVVLALFVAFGPKILGFFHVSIFALEVAGGLILLLFAIGLVLGEAHDNAADTPPNGDMAIYPLAVPLLASPQAIVAVTIFTTAAEPGQSGLIWGALATVLTANLVVLLVVAQVIGGKKKNGTSGGFAQVLLRVVALLLAALAVEIMALGLRGYGVLGPMVAAAVH